MSSLSKSSQTCTPKLAGPFRVHTQNVSNCSTNMLTIPLLDSIVGAPKKTSFTILYLKIASLVGHAKVVERVRKCQPCFFVPWARQPMSRLFVTTEQCDVYDPTYALADLSVEIVPHSKTGPEAVYIPFLTTCFFAAVDFKFWTRIF